MSWRAPRHDLPAALQWEDRRGPNVAAQRAAGRAGGTRNEAGELYSTYYTYSIGNGSISKIGGAMTLGWILLGLVGWAFGLVVVLTLFRMSGDQDRQARHEQKRLDPYSDVTITRSGEA